MDLKLDSLSALLRASPVLELKLAGNAVDEGTISGYASHFGGEPDSYGDVVAPGAYTRTLDEHAREGSSPPMLWMHDLTDPIGRWHEIEQDGRGLFVRGKLNLETEAGRRAYAHVKAGDVRGLSIGFNVFPEGRARNADGSSTLTAINLHEISLVTLPAQRRAMLTSVKSFGTRAELEEILRERLPGRAVKKLLSGGWPALSGAEDEDPSPELEQLASRLDAAQRALKGL